MTRQRVAEENATKGRSARRAGGRHYEEFRIGDVYEHWPGRTLTESDNTWFTLLTMNTHPLHFDKEYARKTEFGRRLVASTLTLSILVGMSVSDVSEIAIANLGWTDVRLPNPLFIGDTLYGSSEVLSKRSSKSRPNAGIVTVRTTGRNQRGDVVCVYDRTVLVPRRGHAAGGKQA